MSEPIKITAHDDDRSQNATQQAFALRASIAARPSLGLAAAASPAFLLHPAGPLLLGAVRAFSVGFGGLQYDTLVEMQEK